MFITYLLILKVWIYWKGLFGVWSGTFIARSGRIILVWWYQISARAPEPRKFLDFFIQCIWQCLVNPFVKIPHYNKTLKFFEFVIVNPYMYNEIIYVTLKHVYNNIIQKNWKGKKSHHFITFTYMLSRKQEMKWKENSLCSETADFKSYCVAMRPQLFSLRLSSVKWNNVYFFKDCWEDL